MRSALGGPAHQLAVRMRINNFTHGRHYNYCPISHAPFASNCASAEGLHFSAFHLIGNDGHRRVYEPHTFMNSSNILPLLVLVFDFIWRKISYRKVTLKVCKCNRHMYFSTAEKILHW